MKVAMLSMALLVTVVVSSSRLMLRVEVDAPDRYASAVLAQLDRRDGTVSGSEGLDGQVRIDAQAPLLSMAGFAADLEQLTEHEGEMSFQLELGKK
jgi:elongation factor G